MEIISAMIPTGSDFCLIFVGKMLGNARSAKLGLKRMEDVHIWFVRDVIMTSAGHVWDRGPNITDGMRYALVCHLIFASTSFW
jgi:hypothetical protein